MNAVYIEITDVCNLNCSFCPCGKANSSAVSLSAKRPREFMNTELFKRCITEAATVAENVYFHVLGEPTLHPGFGQFLKRLEQTPLKLNLTTNGTTIARVSESILKCPAVRQVNFSTHAYAELPQDDAMRHLQDVLDFCKMANAVRPDLYINLRLWNVGDATSNSWNETMLAKVNEAFGTNVELGQFCSRHKSFNVTGRIYLHQDSRFEWPILDERRKTRDERNATGTCRALDTHVAILHDGRVVACCLDYSGQITLGNIADQSLAEILETPLARNLREGFEKHELRHPFCQNCTFCKRFGK
ncbi:radical SAM additional 4Fe4S-binding SPASM domain-containing protein [Fibrobacter sp. UWB15]|jgi:radical SAM protein with 4Fe4S-binding SPASM domain|uniref:radical SAM/SPASM domain-containing protein n=1 Tax=unclassified Fibrobacter TaxID=2634177 RepID=UPI0009235793|nr:MULTISPECIES: SPASM domain-containing protein [unclassified Fibrobacter]PWJ67614.1 radical SAM protein with 4Fe4S-binding SPASM domain [Fibrobacter sp. UWB6]SHF72740.1 radical SAM additional 4Fe4S-binding SPASM domain-containing protein [Fibrobacter sp. UWB8]SMG13133.1 radical SAM additional 4Fe4S-binding SPASM domain-containing protein [Fibrobacter sp. UWB15]